MRIAELYALRRIRVVDGPAPEPKPGEVLVRVKAVGICGSDLHDFLEGRIGDQECVYPMVLGHEPAGLVAKCGAGVTGWREGDPVAVEPALYCYHCEFCRSGRHNICANIRFMSSPVDPGFFREYVVAPAGNLLPVPRGLGLKEATLFEPLAVVLHSLKFAAVRLRATVAVFGAGPIGLLTILALKLSGAGRVWAVEPVAARREMAKAAGADAVLDPTAVDPVREILHDTGRRGVDVAIDCAARDQTMNQCIGVTSNGGRVVITGIPSETQVALDFHVARRKELTLYNVRRSCHDSETALELLAEAPARFGAMITHSLPLEQAQAAFEMLEHYSDGAGKVILEP
jgi:L-iditol 2-dehydrogenase